MKRNLVRLGTIALVATPLALIGQEAPDASDAITAATTAFNAVGTLVVATVTFFLIVKVVKWIRK